MSQSYVQFDQYKNFAISGAQIIGLVWDRFTFCYNKFGTTNQYLKPPSHFLTDVSLLQDHVEKV